MNLLDIGNNVRNYLRQGALNLGFKPLKDNSLGANLRGIGQAGQISTNFAQKKVNNFAQPAYNIPIAGGLVKGIVNQPFNYASSGAQFLQNPNLKTGASFVGQGLNTATMAVSPTGLSFKAGQRIVPQLPNIARQSFLKIGLPSGAGGALDTYGRGGNAGDVAKSFVFNTALGTGAGVGFPLAGRGISNAMSKLTPQQQVAYLKIVGNKSNSKVKIGKSDVPLEVNPFNTPLLERREPNAQDMVDKLFARPIPGREKIRQLKPKVEFLETKKPSNPLTQEARKYKSAEEFAEAQGETLYHGTTNKDAISKNGFRASKYGSQGGGVYFTNNPEQARAISGVTQNSGKTDVVEAILKPDTKLYEVRKTQNPVKPNSLQDRSNIPFDQEIDYLFNSTNANPSKAAQMIRDAGYDGVKLSYNTVVYNPDKIITKSQLTDIWNKANKPKTEQSFLSIKKPTTEKTRGFVSSVKESQNVTKPVKGLTVGNYTQKTNDTLMGEAKALLEDGVTLDFKNTQGLDKKVAATIQEAINQQKTNPQAAANLFNNLSEHATELGRGVQAFSLLDKMSPESIALSAAGRIKKYNQNTSHKIPELTGEQVKLIADKVTAIDLLKGRERNIAINELNNVINSFIPSSLADKFIITWKAGLLTSLRTHERNFVGNTVHQLAEVFKDIPATMADVVLGAKSGQRTKTFTLRGLGKFGAKDTRQQMKDIVAKGFDPSEQINKFDHNQINWGDNIIEKGLKKYTDAVFRTLGASDKPFYNASLARSLYDQAGATAINAGKRGDKAFIDKLVKNPTDEMMKFAISDANVATFKNKNIATNVTANLKRVLGQTPAGKLVGEITMPFTGVPSSIFGQIINYSPAGLVKGILKAGKVNPSNFAELQRQASQEIGRGVIGTGIFGLGSYLMSKGIITGQPKDAAEARQWELENKPRNSIMIGGKWRSLNSIGPESIVFLAGAKLNEELNNPEGSMSNYGVTLGKDLLDQSFVVGLQAPVNAITDPKRYAKSYTGQLISSPIPNIVKDLGKATDSSARETNTITDYAKSSIPFARQSLVERRDVLGRVIPQEPSGAGAFIDLFNSKTPVSNPVVNELTRLNSEGINTTPSKISKTQTIQGVKKTLTPEELNTLEAQTGPVLNEVLGRLVESEYYKALDDEAKSKAIDKAVTNIRKQVKGSINITDNTLSPIDTALNMSSTGQTGNYQILNPTTNSIRTIDIDTPIESPILTGNTELDKKLKSKYTSKITARTNDIVALYEDGQIDSQTAEAKLNELIKQKASVGKAKKGKKPKKIAIKKIAGAKKITNIKIAKASNLKPIKLKKLKLKSAKKVKKVGNIKIANYKLPKIKIT